MSAGTSPRWLVLQFQDLGHTTTDWVMVRQCGRRNDRAYRHGGIAATFTPYMGAGRKS
ncbi:hypothetical protein [Microcoleus anatoxicus]|uniref:Uncharacterized protein n=1 Tax=Microcoleus anatoxicus PTRS2 TaxID=2705321 RepID=A0ABU8YLV2_9CYAN